MGRKVSVLKVSRDAVNCRQNGKGCDTSTSLKAKLMSSNPEAAVA